MEALRYLVFPLQLILDLQKVDPVIHNKMEINQDYLLHYGWTSLTRTGVDPRPPSVTNVEDSSVGWVVLASGGIWLHPTKKPNG